MDKNINYTNSLEGLNKLVLKEFSSFFTSSALTDKNTIGILIPEVLNLIKLKQHPSRYQEFIMCLNIINHSMATDKETCLKTFAFWSKDIQESWSKFAGIYNLNSYDTNLEFDIRAEIILKKVHFLIDEIIKFYVLNTLNHIYINENKAGLLESLRTQDLNFIFSEILSTEKFKNLLILRLNTKSGKKEITLIKLRNFIIQKQYKLNDDNLSANIVNENKSIELLSLTIGQLEECFNEVYYTLITFNLAYTIFSLDHLDEIIKYVPKTL